MTEHRSRSLVFGPFRLDIGNVQLWRGNTRIKLRRKAWEVLSYLVQHPDRLIRKNELLESVWRGGHVTPVALRVCIREIRLALADTSSPQQFIVTEGQLGYRFAVPVAKYQGAYDNVNYATSPDDQPDSLVVGRNTELAQLQHWKALALTGKRQFVLVCGEPGIGKTTVVRTLLESAETEDNIWIGLGQCVEHYGAGEAYRPVLEALSRLCRGVHGEELTELLSKHAPTWMAQMPGLLNSAQRDALRSRVDGIDQNRMLREMAEALEIVSQQRPIMLILEDLHWSDSSTIELLAVMARRFEPANVLLLGTYRPADVSAYEHPFVKAKQELQQHNRCVELCLEYLPSAAVRDYLARRFPRLEPPPRIVQMIHQKSNGNPLFMVSTVNALESQRLILRSDTSWVATQDDNALAEFAYAVPHDLKQMIEQQLGRLNTDDQRLLRVASVAGVEFVTAAVAAALAQPLEDIEEHCEALAHRWPVIRMTGLAEWPDGTLTSRYQFTHALLQNVAYGQLASARKSQLHGAIGRRMEIGFGAQASEIAAELAVHFVQAHDLQRAIEHLHQASKNALRRNAPGEAIVDLSQSLSLLKKLPATTTRDSQELALILTLGPVLMTTRGYSAREVKNIYQRASELCQQRKESPDLFNVWIGLWSYYLVRGELHTAYEMAERILDIAGQTNDSNLLLPAHYVMANTLHPMGRAAASLHHADLGIALYDPQQHHELVLLHAGDPGILCHCLRVRNLWTLGALDQAVQEAERVLSMSRTLNHTHSIVHALGFTAACHQLGRDLDRVHTQAEQMIVLAEQQSFPFWLAAGHLLRGWVLVQNGKHEKGIAEVRQALADSESTGAGLLRSYYLATFAEASGVVGRAQEGLDAIDLALTHVNATDERVYEAELFRLKAELLWQKAEEATVTDNTVLEVEACLLQARRIARKQGSKFFELRATLHLCRFWQSRNKSGKAQRFLTETYGDFSEGFSTPELVQAKALLGKLRSATEVECSSTD